MALADPALYGEDGTQELQDLLRQQAGLRNQLAERENDWLAALEVLEAASAGDPSLQKATATS